MPWYIYLIFEIIYLKILIGCVHIIKYKHLFDMLVETRNSFGWDTKEKALVPRQSRVAEDQIESFFEERNHIMPLTTISNNQLWKINTELCYSLKPVFLHHWPNDFTDNTVEYTVKVIHIH